MGAVYKNTSLGTASVIISFHEQENVSLIFHTIHAVFQNTPQTLLKEIVLIDDGTTSGKYKTPRKPYSKR